MKQQSGPASRLLGSGAGARLSAGPAGELERSRAAALPGPAPSPAPANFALPRAHRSQRPCGASPTSWLRFLAASRESGPCNGGDAGPAR